MTTDPLHLAGDKFCENCIGRLADMGFPLVEVITFDRGVIVIAKSSHHRVKYEAESLSRALAGIVKHLEMEP